MIPIISIVGKSGSGKTTLLEKVVADLVGRGYKVATIKHDAHGFDIDREGKDSWRHKKAGARTVVLSSPEKVAVVKDVDNEMQPANLASKFIDDVDIVITEGYKKGPFPKIEVVRQANSRAVICKNDKNLFGIASDLKFKYKNIPCVGINNSRGVASLIEKKFLLNKGELAHSSQTELIVNGEHIPLKPFINSLITEAVKGMINSLKGCGSPEMIELRISSLRETT